MGMGFLQVQIWLPVPVPVTKTHRKPAGYLYPCRTLHEKHTVNWRRQHNIPNSDGFEEILQEVQKRGTMSTTESDSHDPKRSRLGGVSE
jgi:hypothetical protein